MSTSTRGATPRPQNHFKPIGLKNWNVEELHNTEDETTETQEDCYNPIDNTYYENPQYQEANFHSATDQ